MGELGVLDGWLVDRAFGVDIPLIEVSKLPVGGRSACSTRWRPPRWPVP